MNKEKIITIMENKVETIIKQKMQENFNSISAADTKSAAKEIIDELNKEFENENNKN